MIIIIIIINTSVSLILSYLPNMTNSLFQKKKNSQKKIHIQVLHSMTFSHMMLGAHLRVR